MTETVVFAGTGKVGREVVRALVAMGIRPRVFTRSVAKATSLFGDSVTAIEGNFDDVAALQQAVEGAESIFLASPVDPHQVTWQGRVINAAASSRPLVVKLSGLATNPESFVDSGRWHAETETAIKQLKLPYVFLHANYFLQNLARSAPIVLKSSVLSADAKDALIAPVDTRDIGAVAAQLLTGQVNRTGSTLTLTAAETFTHEMLADLLGQLAGQTIKVLERPDADTRDFLLEVGVPEWYVDILLQFNRAFREGFGARVSTDVEDVLGRPPLSIRNYLNELVAENTNEPSQGQLTLNTRPSSVFR